MPDNKNIALLEIDAAINNLSENNTMTDRYKTFKINTVYTVTIYAGAAKSTVSVHVKGITKSGKSLQVMIDMSDGRTFQRTARIYKGSHAEELRIKDLFGKKVISAAN